VPDPRVVAYEHIQDRNLLAPRRLGVVVPVVGEPHLAAPADGPLEAVVVRDGPARRQLAPLCGDALDRPSKLDLGLEQPIACAAVLAGLAGEAGVRVYRQRGWFYRGG
jgi:hypothetical protein